MTLLSLRGLRVVYAGHAPVLDGLDLDVAVGEAVGLVGPSGTGKTTLGLALAGLAGWNGAQVSGEVRWRDELVPARRLADLRGHKIAYLPQEPRAALNPFRSCGNQVGEAVTDRRTRRARVATLLTLVGLDPSMAASFPHRLSGGMCQRVLLAAALAGEPALLVADEPTASLDPLHRRRVLDLLVRLRAELGLAIVLISHDPGAVRSVCGDRVVILGQDTVVTA